MRLHLNLITADLDSDPSMSPTFQNSIESTRIGNSEFRWGERTFIMGVVNATPDSFSGDGVLSTAGEVQAAIDQALRMEDEGADIIDVGGESTRPASIYPDAKPVPTDDELERVVPVIEGLSGRLGIPISIDTRKALVARAALEAGAALANDVSMLSDSEMKATIVDLQRPIVVSHIRHGGHKGDVVADVTADLADAIKSLEVVGVSRSKIVVDPGIGFAKSAEQSISLMKSLPQLKANLGLPLLVGTSRKSFIGATTGEPIEDRAFGTAATVALSIQNGADIVRVHDVAKMGKVVKMSDALTREFGSGRDHA